MSFRELLRRPFRVLFAIFAIALLSVSCFAQFETASVLGYVRDSAGAAIAGSALTLTNVDTGVTTQRKADDEGRFEFTSVKAGSYRITTEMAGFEKTTTEPFVVTVNARQRVDVSMKVGSASDSVTVTSAAQLLETETSSRGEVIGAKQIANLPLNGRSYADLALLVPGVRKSSLENVNSTSSREASFNVNGQRSAFNNFLLDGLDNNNYGTSN